MRNAITDEFLQEHPMCCAEAQEFALCYRTMWDVCEALLNGLPDMRRGMGWMIGVLRVTHYVPDDIMMRKVYDFAIEECLPFVRLDSVRETVKAFDQWCRGAISREDYRTKKEAAIIDAVRYMDNSYGSGDSDSAKAIQAHNTCLFSPTRSVAEILMDPEKLFICPGYEEDPSEYSADYKRIMIKKIRLLSEIGNPFEKEMTPMTVDEFVEKYRPCEQGEQFASGYKTMHEVYEALLDGEAYDYSFEWALWVLQETRDDVEDLFLWFVDKVRPMLPESLRDMVRVDSFYRDDSNDPERTLYHALRDYRTKKLPEYYTPECTHEHKKQLYAIITCLAALVGNLSSAGSSCFSACLLEEALAAGEELCEIDTELLRQSIGQQTTSLLKYQEPFLARLREFGNPFQASESNENNT